MVTTFAQALMGAEADAICGAGYGERSEERRNAGNGYRTRDWDARAGIDRAATPQLRQASYSARSARAATAVTAGRCRRSAAGDPRTRRGTQQDRAKAAALLHSLARNHSLVDGNKRLALAGVIALYGVNGRRLTLSNDEAYHLVMAVADGSLDDGAIASRLGPATESRS